MLSLQRSKTLSFSQEPEGVHNLLDVGGERSLEPKRLVVARMTESQLCSVESRSCQLFEYAEGLFATPRGASWASVISISHNRKACFRKMYPDLVSASCLDPNRKKRRERKGFDPFRLGRCRLGSSGSTRNLLSVALVASKRLLQTEMVGRRAVDQREIAFFNRAAGELESQRPMGVVVFGHDDES